ncbi:serine hydrolase domain-containing protein [Parapedobacter koreensis]|uniref:CubicO group peptidase, beta-lactamase class C family n=1 Tax=Parapedobacter koreensis TaxID=332977 RepID=A0A1H7F3T7_9SPHI|nr:serine hydrolase domain-containing protein [Parapedobacter koreensis]SEK17795.1 CubicO group peptidase, beta-lactamase class C family [Parapedobacter koreensis]
MKKMYVGKWLVINLVVFALTAACSKDTDEPQPEPPELTQEDISGIDERMENFITDHGFPGASLAVSKDGQLVYRKGYGQADVESGEEVTADSRFRVASVSKLFTSVAVMQLIQDGRLAMDQKVFGPDGILATDYGTQPYKPYITDITLSDLLHHTIGGWGQDNDPAFFDRSLDADGVINWTVDNLPLANAPGSAFAYSNFGYMLLASVIEKTSGKPYAQYVQEEILNEVGATQTAIASTSLAGRLEQEVKYYGQGGDVNFVYDYTQFARAAGAFGWLSTPTDLLRFATAVDGAGTRPDILTQATIETMTTVTPASKGFGFDFGCGWVVQGDEWFWWGSLPGTFAILYRNGNGICIAAAANGRRQPTPENGLYGFINIINYIAFEETIPWQDIDQF